MTPSPPGQQPTTEAVTPQGQRRAASVERPRTMTEAAHLLRETTGSVLIRGGGTKLEWAGHVPNPDLILDTTSMQGVLTYNPADMTASVRAGTTLRALQEHLAQNNQWFALDPPSGRVGATVGGLLAAGDSGPSRLRYGGIRDLVIGVTLVLADGTIARSGGHVIKNVAGYDMAKLVHGSLGSLALVAEVVVRLHPRPEASITTSGAAGAEQATAAALAIAASPLEPAAVEWVSDNGPGQLLVRIDGTAAIIEATSRRLARLLAQQGIMAAPLAPEDAATAWTNHAVAVRGTDQETVTRIAGRPAHLADLAGRATAIARRAGVGIQLVSSAALGIHTIRFHDGTPEAHAHAFTQLREYARSQGASVLLRQRAPGVEALVDALGPRPSTVQLLQRIKAQFDPTLRLAPGRFGPWY